MDEAKTSEVKLPVRTKAGHALVKLRTELMCAAEQSETGIAHPGTIQGVLYKVLEILIDREAYESSRPNH